MEISSTIIKERNKQKWRDRDSMLLWKNQTIRSRIYIKKRWLGRNQHDREAEALTCWNRVVCVSHSMCFLPLTMLLGCVYMCIALLVKYYVYTNYWCIGNWCTDCERDMIQFMALVFRKRAWQRAKRHRHSPYAVVKLPLRVRTINRLINRTLTKLCTFLTTPATKA